MPGTAARQDFQSMLAGFAQLERVMKQKQDDDMYNKMLDELDKGKQHHGGKIEYQGYRNKQTDELTHLVRQAQLERATREPSGHAQYGEDGMTPFQRESLKRRDAREGRLDRGSTKPPSWNKMESEVSAATGGHLRDWMSSDPGTHKFINAQGQGDNNGQIFAADYNDAEGKTQHLRAPRAYYDATLHNAMNNGVQGGAPNAGAPDAQALAAQAVYDNPAKDYAHSIPGANEAAPAAKAGPSPGETRTVGGKQYQWDGQGWLLRQ